MIIKEIVFLVVMVMTGTNNSPLFYYHEIPTMQQCFAIVENGQIHIPDAGDAEATVTMYCAPTKVGYWHYKEYDKSNRLSPSLVPPKSPRLLPPPVLWQ